MRAFQAVTPAHGKVAASSKVKQGGNWTTALLTAGHIRVYGPSSRSSKKAAMTGEPTFIWVTDAPAATTSPAQSERGTMHETDPIRSFGNDLIPEVERAGLDAHQYLSSPDHRKWPFPNHQLGGRGARR